MNRREVLKSGALVLGAGAMAGDSGKSEEKDMIEHVLQEGPIKLTRDCLDLDAQESTSLMSYLAKNREIVFGQYSTGGIVRELEEKLAAVLGKEDAIFMPTGTLANHLALRSHCQGDHHRVITQAESHVYNDSGDGAQRLAGLNVMPLAPGAASFRLAEVEERVQRSRSSKVKFDVGAIAIESPVRRRANTHFPFDEMKRISRFAKENEIAMHLDGARIFIESAYTGIDVKDYARQFDSVYVSLYKTFHSPSGAILAGPKSMIEGMYHTRRLYGASMPQVWPFVAIALAFVDGTVDRLRTAIAVFDGLMANLENHKSFQFDAIPHGTNITKMRLKGADPQEFRAKLANRGIILPPANLETGVFNLKTNETLNRHGASQLAEAFRACI